MSAWLGPAIVTGLFGTGGAIAGAAATHLLDQRAEKGRAIRADRQRLKEAKGERLRRLYAPLAGSAEVLRGLAGDTTFRIASETDEERQERRQSQITKAVDRVDAVLGDLLIESDAARMAEAYKAVGDAYASYMLALRFGTGRLSELLDALQSAVETLWQLAQEHLKEFDVPISDG